MTTAHRRSGLRLALLLLATLAALSAFRFAVTNGDFRNSDDAANLLAGAAMSEGNIRLHGWIMTPENYYPTDVLAQCVLKLLFGFHPLSMQIAESVIWAAVAIAGTFLAGAGQKPRHLTGAVSIALALLAFNVFEHGFPDVVIANIGSHGSTILLTLLTFAAASALIPGAAPLLVVLMTVGAFSDRIYLTTACLPMLAEAVLALDRRDPRPALVRIAATIGSVALARSLLALNAATGGFQLFSFPLSLASFPQFLDHLGFAADSLIRLLGADFFGRPLQGRDAQAALITLLRVPFALMFLVVCWDVGAVVLRRVRRWPSAAATPRPHAHLEHLLWFSLVFCVASTCVTTAIINPACIRYFLPAAVAGSILVARRFGRSTLTGGFGAIAALASLIVGLDLRSHAPPGRVVSIEQLYRITDALRANHLERGYAGYWEGPIVTALSRRRITSLSVNEGADHRLHPFLYLADREWYRTAARTWNGRIFFISERSDDPDLCVAPEPAVIRQFGRPVQRIDLGQFVINVYDLPPGALASLAPDG